jgi:hypothetical protein
MGKGTRPHPRRRAQPGTSVRRDPRFDSTTLRFLRHQIEPFGHSAQLGKGTGLHLLHRPAAMHLYRGLGYADIEGNLFAEAAARDLDHDLALSRAQRGEGFPEDRVGLEDLFGAVRQQQVLGRLARRGRPVEVQAYADRIVIRQDGMLVGEHRRRFGRGATIYDPWHYVPVLTRKPGALRNGAPFKDWPLPASLERVRRRLQGSDDGDRQMVKILSAVLTDGLAAVEAACAEALAGGVHSADVVLNILSRQRDPGPTATILTPEALRLRQLPLADCARYDSLRRAS